MSNPKQQNCQILSNRQLQDDYWQVDLAADQIAPLVQPGQFVHVRLPRFEHRLLRRPFSVCDVDTASGRLNIVYKVVGQGTAHLAGLSSPTMLDLIGPLGNGFTLPTPGDQPIIVAGGYGCAATWLLARRSPHPPYCLLGGRSRNDLLLLEQYRSLGGQLQLATDDGSAGHRGFITELLDRTLRTRELTQPKIYACGPAAMLQAVAKLAQSHGLIAEISLDHAMCCGVGACFACVVRQKANNEAGWTYVRTCREGPVFKSDLVIWD